jgi:hypothetical protein
MNCAFFSVLSTSLSIAVNLATSSSGTPPEPMIPVSVYHHYGESFVVDHYTLRCNDGGNLFVRHVALYGAASLPTNWR